MSLNSNEIRDLIKEQIDHIYDNTGLSLRLPHRLKLLKSKDVSYSDIVFQYPGFKLVDDKAVFRSNVEIDGDLNNILQKLVMDYLDRNNITTIKNNVFVDLYYSDKKEYEVISNTARNYILDSLSGKEYKASTVEAGVYHISNSLIESYHSLLYKQKKTIPIVHLYISNIIKDRIRIYNRDEYDCVLFEKSKILYPYEVNEILGNLIEIYNYKSRFKDINKIDVYLSLVENTLFTKHRFNELEQLFTVEDISYDILISNIR